ncbi:hypothetical protein TSUD_301610 [Trifolium subterraneum]|uniref:MCM C-terminal AAA(+) ATPase domain-containing protein n=1 Tax=Trifolium subterraneum TaxID=3900 RepID=A0A2Z6PA96_TRISU|nr:hypothetical protein TSUD_301610 [Trifolium subterraneum]
MELNSTFISDDNPNKDINIAFYNIPIVKRSQLSVYMQPVTIEQSGNSCAKRANLLLIKGQNAGDIQICCFMNVILRHDSRTCQGWVIFTGTVVVIPDNDILPLASPGERSEWCRGASRCKGSTPVNKGGTGILQTLFSKICVYIWEIIICCRLDCNLRNQKLAGALKLADNGNCSIDEFDKMNITDQGHGTAHYWYHKSRNTSNTPLPILLGDSMYNVALPPAILLRFDLVYIMVDDPDETIDTNMAQHIVKVHQMCDDALHPAFSTAEVKRYVAYAKTLKPKVQPHHVDEAEKMLKTSIIRQDIFSVLFSILILELAFGDNCTFYFLSCHVKSSEIDLSEFQELNREDATGNGN